MRNEANPACYCTALRRATRRVSTLYDAALAPIGIGVAQLASLRALERAGMPTISELGSELGLDRSTVGRKVKVLARMGLLRIDRHAGDLRESAVMITAEGRGVLARADPLWTGVQKTIEDQLGAGGADRLVAVLRRL